MYTTQASARAAGAKTYMTGVPCKHGHTTFRYVSGGGCRDCLAARAKSPEHKEERAETLLRWNASTKGYAAKQRWKAKDPKNAWACSAVGGAKARATARGLSFDLDKAYVVSITPDVCPVFKQPFVFVGKALGPWSPSIDRKDPRKGYIKGNIAVISLRANAIKSDASQEEIQAVLTWLQQNY